MTTVGYAVMGRVLSSRKPEHNYSVDEITILERLAMAHSDIDFVVISPTSDHVVDLPNVHAATTHISRSAYETMLEKSANAALECDELIVFLNQHTSVSLLNKVPKLNGEGTVKPLQQPVRTVAPVVAAVNAWQDDDPWAHEPIYICNDARSGLMCRDIKWPPRAPILAQWNGIVEKRHYRFGDDRSPELFGYRVATETPGHWTATHRYEYASLELVVKTLEVA